MFRFGKTKTYKIKMQVIKTTVEQVEIIVTHVDKQLARQKALKLVGEGHHDKLWDELGRNLDINGNPTYEKHPSPVVVARSHNNKIATHRTEPKVVSLTRIPNIYKEQ